jgi:hypothetical protein
MAMVFLCQRGSLFRKNVCVPSKQRQTSSVKPIKVDELCRFRFQINWSDEYSCWTLRGGAGHGEHCGHDSSIDPNVTTDRCMATSTRSLGTAMLFYRLLATVARNDHAGQCQFYRLPSRHQGHVRVARRHERRVDRGHSRGGHIHRRGSNLETIRHVARTAHQKEKGGISSSVNSVGVRCL